MAINILDGTRREELEQVKTVCAIKGHIIVVFMKQKLIDAQLRFIKSKSNDSRFYLTLIPVDCIKYSIWYYSTPLGKNQLGKFISGAKLILTDQTNGTESKCSRSKVFTLREKQRLQFC